MQAYHDGGIWGLSPFPPPTYPRFISGKRVMTHGTSPRPALDPTARGALASSYTAGYSRCDGENQPITAGHPSHRRPLVTRSRRQASAHAQDEPREVKRTDRKKMVVGMARAIDRSQGHSVDQCKQHNKQAAQQTKELIT